VGSLQVAYAVAGSIHRPWYLFTNHAQDHCSISIMVYYIILKFFFL